MPKTNTKAQPHLFANSNDQEPVIGDQYRRDQVAIHFDHAENLYFEWPSPTCIISDGP